MTEVPAEYLTSSTPKRNKYGAVATAKDGYRFASIAEARRYEELRLLLIAGEIRSLVIHPRFALYVPERMNDGRPWPDADRAPTSLPTCEGEYGPRCWVRRIGYYTGDFLYERAPGWDAVLEDVKGGGATRTEAYRLRKRMVEASYGLVVVEIG